MLHEVRIYDPQGNLKRVVPPEALTFHHFDMPITGPGTSLRIHQEIICKKCGAMFRTYRSDTLTCDRCRAPKALPRPQYNKVCKCCKSKFMANTKSQKFCNVLCNKTYKRKPVPPEPKRPCSVCGKTFQPKNRRNRACSSGCGKELWRCYREPLAERKCKQCGVVFQPNHPQRIFCTKPCQTKAKNARRRVFAENKTINN